MSERYPLWCVDTGEANEEMQYRGPFAIEAEAVQCAEKLEAMRGMHGGPIGKVRRCRRLRPSELDLPTDGDNLLDVLNDGVEPSATRCWADWEEPLLWASTDLTTAFSRWLDETVETRVFVCDGDE